MELPGILPSGQISNVACQAHWEGEVLPVGAGSLIPGCRYYHSGVCLGT